MLLTLRFDGRAVDQYFQDTHGDLSLSRSFNFWDIEEYLVEVALGDTSPETISKAISDIRTLIRESYEEDQKMFIEVMTNIQKQHPEQDSPPCPRAWETPIILFHCIPDDVDILDPYHTRTALNIGLENERLSFCQATAIVLLDAMYRVSRLIDYDKWEVVGEIAVMVNQWHYAFVIAERREKGIFIEQIKKYKSTEARKAALKSHEGLYKVREKIISLFKQGQYKSTRQASFTLAPKAIELSKSCNRPLVISNAQRTVYDWLRNAE